MQCAHAKPPSPKPTAQSAPAGPAGQTRPSRPTWRKEFDGAQATSFGGGGAPLSSRYHEVYAAWKRDPETFWAEAAREIDWYKPWNKVFDPYAGQYGRWFVGG